VLPFIPAITCSDRLLMTPDRSPRPWERIATDLAAADRIGHDITLDDLDAALTAILNGEATGRSVVDLSR
jgi:hypothetical protein